ncbi:MAG: ShlB/FhaC/HecB family hemolysin secretion/activation protein, partial [Alkalinema sp. RL_2_19]|nr:ShlB/FhaC/HecB family hemolysin secretion/activation protein [Alkalinema sp. RL_2_19]
MYLRSITGLIALAIILGSGMPAAQAQTTAPKIQIQQLKYVGNTVFSVADLDQVTQPWRDQGLSFDDLLAMQAAISQHYEQAGYIGTVVEIPVTENQDLNADRATVSLKITEGRLDQVITNATRNRWVTARLLRQKPLNQAELLTQLQLLRLDPAIVEIQAELLPTGTPGAQQLRLNVTDAPRFAVTIGSNNRQSDNSGRWAANLNATWQSPLGFGDTLHLGNAYTAGGLDWSIGYQMPLNPSGKTQLNLDYRQARKQIIND